MAETQIINHVRSYASGTPGRSLNNVGVHHFVIDEPAYNGGPGEEITPGDAFFSGISSCGVLLLERFAAESHIPLVTAEAVIEGVREPSDLSQFTRVGLFFKLVGPTQTQAEQLVERYKRR